MSPTELRAKSEIEFVTFFAGGQSFSLDIVHVREIRSWSQVTPLPHAPSEVLGVMNLRGSVIPIYDLAICFGLPPTPHSPRNVVIIAMQGKQVLGLLVEAVSEIMSITTDKIQDTPDVNSDLARQAITGVITIEDGMTRVIDLGAVVRAPDRLIA